MIIHPLNNTTFIGLVLSKKVADGFLLLRVSSFNIKDILVISDLNINEISKFCDIGSYVYVHGDLRQQEDGKYVVYAYILAPYFGPHFNLDDFVGDFDLED
ncbi:MAG TPA: hypothetical protein ENO30_04490 [Thermodesulfobium narugense]|nr:hypothetical protein [Thermodesulfobium narugense]